MAYARSLMLVLMLMWMLMSHASMDFFVLSYLVPILGLQSISRDVADNVCHAHRLDPTMELITYSFACVAPPTWPPWRQVQTINMLMSLVRTRLKA